MAKDFDRISPADIPEATKIFVNGCWVGIHGNPNLLEKELRQSRRQDPGFVSSEVSIVRDIHTKELRINTDYGRCSRPLFIVEKQGLLIKKKDVQALDKSLSLDQGGWHDLVAKGFIEYIDTEEEETTMISMTINDLFTARMNPEAAYSETYTYCEIHPSLILSVCASTIPLPDHNQCPYNTSQSRVAKQAMGMYMTNYQSRMNSIVDIAAYSGFNQGDSIIMNQSSIDRGFFRSSSLRSYRDDEEKLDSLVTEDFCRPDKCDMKGMENSSYNELDDDGFAPPGTRVSGDTVIIGKTRPLVKDEDQVHTRYTRRDHSFSLPHRESGVVDQALLTTNAEGRKSVKVRVRYDQIPQIGDKFSSRHGQKGTIGMVYTQEDMPWTVEGITPDIILNPHSLPSRMTTGQLTESILGKVAALDGKERDSTPFSSVNMDVINKTLQKHGYQKWGYERMYCAHTGKKLNGMIYIGATFYQRLKQTMDSKIHSRDRGPMQILTKQPTEGRFRYGGQRFGEMERDCVIAHGAAIFLKERMFDLSDPYRVHVCERCGLIAIANITQKTLKCKGCKSRVHIVQVLIPYTFKLLLQELKAMCIAPRMLT